MATTTTRTAPPSDVDEQVSPLACNVALVIGELVTEPELRTLPAGGKLLSFSLTVRQPGERTTSVPLSWFEPPKRTESWTLGTRIVASGPVVRRFYQYAGGTGARTEVQVEHAEIATRRVASKRIISGIASQVDAALATATG